MHGFLILFYIATTTADQLGYSYQQIGQNPSVGGFELADNVAGNEHIRTGAIGNSLGATNALGSGFGGFNSANNAHGIGVNGLGADSGSGIADNQLNSEQQNIEYNKEFYSYTAPAEDFNDHDASEQALNSLKKNLRVIFIRTPENQALTNAALRLAQQSNEDRTAIYVLTKQADIGELTNQLQTIRGGHSNKPEVHFVKYRTPEEAAHAQQVIQSQYDALGGESHTSNEGVATVLNFATSNTASGGSNGVSTGSSSTGNAGYLPPAKRRA